MFALNDCTKVVEADFVTVGIAHRVGSTDPNPRDLDDQMLLKFIAPLATLPRLAATDDGVVRFHDEEDCNANKLRAAFLQFDPRKIRAVTVDPSQQSMATTFQIGHELFSAEFTFDNDNVKNIDITGFFGLLTNPSCRQHRLGRRRLQSGGVGRAALAWPDKSQLHLNSAAIASRPRTMIAVSNTGKIRPDTAANLPS